jgi:hypothetical protein
MKKELKIVKNNNNRRDPTSQPHKHDFLVSIWDICSPHSIFIRFEMSI